jgi:E3 ubiquitin-protein ligase MARCH6
MTRNQYVNNIIITAAEGYIITLLVVVSLILIFLIREWVVQQQFGANLRAGFNQDLAAADRPRAPPVPEEPAPVNIPEARDVGQRPMARPRRRAIQPEDPEAAVRRAARREERRQAENGEGHRQQRPAPVRDALAPAAEIQRQLTEEPRMTEEFLAIWRRADSDPQEVLRIIEAENKSDEMRYWVNAMKTLEPQMRHNGQGLGEPSTPRTAARRRADRTARPNSRGNGAQQARDESDRCSSDSWEDIPDSWEDVASSVEGEERVIPTEHHESVSTPRQQNFDLSSSKGKEKESEEPIEIRAARAWNVPIPFDTNGSSASRPRAVSDGPQLKDGISPLANNSWSFKNLPDAEKEESPRLQSTPSFDIPEELSNSQPLPNSTQSAFGASIPEEPIEGTDTEGPAQGESTPTNSGPPPFEPQPYGPVTIRHQDGTERTYANWDEVFDANPLSNSDQEPARDNAEPEQPALDDTPPPEAAEQAVARPAEPQGVLGNVADWLWGGVEDVPHNEDADDEQDGGDLAVDPRFAAGEGNLFDQGAFADQDREVAEAAMAAGIDPNDQDAIDDAEDFEGIMELIGMRGPLFNLAQNSLFSAFLLALTVAFGVWIPYNIGRVTLLLAANPGPALKLPLRLSRDDTGRPIILRNCHTPTTYQALECDQSWF